MSSLALAMTAEIARTTQQHIFVRGTMLTIVYSGFIAVFVSLSRIIVSLMFGIPRSGNVVLELQYIALTAFATALSGPLVWRLFRRIDAAYARTHRDRDAALEGLT